MNAFIFLMQTCIFILCFCVSVFSQPESPGAPLIEHQLEQYSQSGDETPDLSELTDAITTLMEHPLNLNKAEEPELTLCSVFSPQQIHNLLAHREKYGQLISIEELQVIEGFPVDFIRKIQPFVTTGKSISDPNASLSRMIRDGEHQLIIRAMMVPETKKGFEEKIYEGSPAALYMRYRFRFMRNLSWGFTAEKDAGEQFFKGTQKKGFDYYSAHIAYRKNSGFIRQFVVGDFQLGFGQGLTLSTGLSSGKSTDPVAIKGSPQGIRPYTSSNEVYFKRGAAVSFQLKKITIDLFGSYRKMDGNLSGMDDSLSGNELFTSFQESGYHRTTQEVSDKNSITEFMYGTHIRYHGKQFQSGVTAVKTHWNLPLIKNTQPYNKFEFNGNSLWNAGWDYSYVFRNVNIFGEISYSQNGAIAHVNGIVASLDPKLAVSILYRHYPREYQAIYSGAIKESGNNFNERGVYAGINFRPFRVLGFSMYYDRFYFPWLKYSVNAPSFGYEWNSQLTYTPSRKTEIYIRYRESWKEENSPEENLLIKNLTPTFHQGLRFHITTKISKKFTFRTRVEWVRSRSAINSEQGFMIFQDIQYHPMASWLSFNMRYAIFDTDGYDSRIYAYENDVLYGYSIPGYYYKGSRIYLNTRIRVHKGIDVWLRYAATFYSNRDLIGSGYEEIEGSKRSEIKAQIRFIF